MQKFAVPVICPINADICKRVGMAYRFFKCQFVISIILQAFNPLIGSRRLYRPVPVSSCGLKCTVIIAYGSKSVWTEHLIGI